MHHLMAQHAAAPIMTSILSVNVNGLTNARKRQQMFAYLLDGPWQVILLQETHTINDTETQAWMQEGAGPGRPWQGLGFWCHSSIRRRQGVAVLIHHRALHALGRGPAAPAATFSSRDGRTLRVDWGPTGNKVSVISVYGPCLIGERRDFYSLEGSLAQALRAGAAHNTRLFVGGDFNCVMETRDVIGTQVLRYSDRTRGRRGLQDLMGAYGLIDVWRHTHPDINEATHASTNNTSHARLDMVFIPADLAQAGWVTACSHHHLFPVGDHVPVLLQLADPGTPKEGPGVWRFPLPLLQDIPFMHSLRTSLTNLLQQWQPNHPDAINTPMTARWEEVKSHIHTACRTHQWHLRQQERAARTAQLRVLQAHARGMPLPPTPYGPPLMQESNVASPLGCR